jgi:hypothetical protein
MDFMDFKRAYVSVRRESLYSILIEFGVPMKLVRVIKMCLHETYGKVRTGKHFSDSFLIQNGLKQGDDFHHWLSNLLYNIPRNGQGNPSGTEFEWDTSAFGLC